MDNANPTANPEQMTIYNLYALFGVSIVASVIPMISAAVVSLLLFLILLIAAYMVRGKVEAHSLIENHATFIIRTLWITALFSVLTSIIASIYMMSWIDYSYFESCANTIAGYDMNALESMDAMQIYALIEPCVEDFINGNFQTFIVATLIGGGPLVLYLGYRFVKGLSRAVKGYRLADVKGWF